MAQLVAPLVSVHVIVTLSIFQSSAAVKTSKANPQVYMDIKIGNKPSGRIVIQLRADIVPLTAGLLNSLFLPYKFADVH